MKKVIRWRVTCVLNVGIDFLIGVKGRQLNTMVVALMDNAMSGGIINLGRTVKLRRLRGITTARYKIMSALCN